MAIDLVSNPFVVLNPKQIELTLPAWSQEVKVNLKHV